MESHCPFGACGSLCDQEKGNGNLMLIYLTTGRKGISILNATWVDENFRTLFQL